MQQMQISFIRVVHGMHTTERRLDRVERTADHPDIAETVEHAIRVHYGLLEEDAENANNDPKAETQVSEE